ncbi:3114_t:CDS:2 [Entrophospora sp. SA101]|nr:3114_t:CDS:2 [Entrophospora sp. SA101]
MTTILLNRDDDDDDVARTFNEDNDNIAAPLTNKNIVDFSDDKNNYVKDISNRDDNVNVTASISKRYCRFF